MHLRTEEKDKFYETLNTQPLPTLLGDANSQICKAQYLKAEACVTYYTKK